MSLCASPLFHEPKQTLLAQCSTLQLGELRWMGSLMQDFTAAFHSTLQIVPLQTKE